MSKPEPSSPWVRTCNTLPEKPADPIELRVYRGANGAFTLYEDEGTTRLRDGAYATIPILGTRRHIP